MDKHTTSLQYQMSLRFLILKSLLWTDHQTPYQGLHVRHVNDQPQSRSLRARGH